MLGRILSIQEVRNIMTEYVTSDDDIQSRLMDGYEIETDKHKFYILIDNQQSCCEDWGYFSSDDDLDYYIGAELIEVNLTDNALNKKKVEESGYYEDEGGIQFVDFVTDKGVFQLAVYNAHNGYYGHEILVIKDNEILLSDVL